MVDLEAFREIGFGVQLVWELSGQSFGKALPQDGTFVNVAYFTAIAVGALL